MLVLKVELWPAVTGEIKNIGTAIISNDGTGDTDRGNYDVVVLRAGFELTETTPLVEVEKNVVRRGRVEGWWRARPVWSLVYQALRAVAGPSEK